MPPSVPQACDRRAGRRAVAGVPGEDVGQALLVEHGERFLQSAQQIGRRGVGEVEAGIGLEHRPPVPVAARQLRAVSTPASARGLTALNDRPGGSISPFWLPATVTSTPHSSWR